MRAAKIATAVVAATPNVTPSVSFPIVGIGASAGGLEALEQFLANVPERSGMAFVVVQHLDPTRKGAMPELLQRTTGMRVIQVRDRTRVQPDCVYVIPPGKDMSLLRGALHLFTPSEARGLRLPIDTFLRSLAQDQHRQSIGVILSGMGADGTLGFGAIKAAGGITLVQDPTDAKFDSMPRSAIDAGLADVVASATALPGRIQSHLEHKPHRDAPGLIVDERMKSGLAKIIILLRERTGHDFGPYKKNTLYRRIERRMTIHQIAKMPDYIRYLRENAQELDLLFKELLIGVTSFFRDPAAWIELREHGLPSLLASRQSGIVRAWVAGCSTGEEAYSLAIAFNEAMESAKPPVKRALQVFATDLDRDAIDFARQGLYPASIAADVSPERLSRYFSKDGTGYRVRNSIREQVIFAPHSVILDPPFTKLDLLSCRNLLIYLTPEMQKKLFPLFHYSLREGGVLFLGSSETIGGFTSLFTPISAKARLFSRGASALRTQPIDFPSSFSPAPHNGHTIGAPHTPPRSLQAMAEQLVLRQYAPPTVLVNDEGNILYISGKTGKYLEPAAGKANWNIFAMAREGLDAELSAAFPKALRQKAPVTTRGTFAATDGNRRFVDITVQRLDDPEPLRGLAMIVFTDVAAPELHAAASNSRPRRGSSVRVTALEAELQQARLELQSTREGMQSSQEELKSTNEEMQSTNEELQSTNEELTTSKEEMQSMNEELQTVNRELQAKVDELSHVSNDMKNLLNSTDIATLFLDNELQVRRFTTQATKIIKLIPGDVGRPITDLSSDLLYPELADDTREVLRSLGSAEKPIAGRDGRWFTVRIMPYRTLDDRIDGVVITFADITVAKTLEAELRKKQGALERHVTRQAGQMERAKVKAQATGTSHRRGAKKPGT